MRIKLEPVVKSVTTTCVAQEVAVPIEQCASLVQACQSYGVEGYRVGSYTPSGFLSRYTPIQIPFAPMLVYPNQIMIPLVFRNGSDCEALLNQPKRLKAFFQLLDWYLAYEPETIILDYKTSQGPFANHEGKIVDSALVAFRLQEIIHCGVYAMKNFESMEEFAQWNRNSRLIKGQAIGRHSRILDLDNPKVAAECNLVFGILALFFPEAPLAQKMPVAG